MGESGWLVLSFLGYLSPVLAGTNRSILDSSWEPHYQKAQLSNSFGQKTLFHTPSLVIPTLVPRYLRKSWPTMTLHCSATPVFNQTLQMRHRKRLDLKRPVDRSELQWCGGVGMLLVQSLITSSLANLRLPWTASHSLPPYVSELASCN